MPVRIESIEATSGFLEHAPIFLKAGLNCIIGSRGTCKSTLVETIRFALNCDKAKIADLIAGSDNDQDFGTKGLIKATLRGGTVVCRLVDETPLGTTTYQVEREAESDPRILQDDVLEPGVSILGRVEIYSQGDLQRIADQEDLRLKLIDQPNLGRLEPLFQERESAAATLRELGPQIRTIRAVIGAKKSEASVLPEMRTQLHALQAGRPALPPELEEERKAYSERRAVLESFKQAAILRSTVGDAVIQASENAAKLTHLLESVATSTDARSAGIVELLSRFRDLLNETRAKVSQELSQDAMALVDSLATQFKTDDLRYHQLRQEQEAVSEVLRREDALKADISKLEKVHQDLIELSTREATLVHSRSACRRKIQDLNSAIFDIRLSSVESINADYGDIVALTITSGVATSEYTAKVNSTLQGSRLRNQDELAALISQRIDPSILIDLVEAGNSQALASMLERDVAQAARIISYLLDHPGLYELESTVFEDRLEITMYDEGVPKPVSQLSKGQKATALLPMILRNGDVPLIFDQPEDDLDNRFIYQSLVSKIRELKPQRQMIFVTHNANIPVLGDADQVVVMSMKSPEKAGPPFIGSVEDCKLDIVNLLEGGTEAFRRREERYRDVLHKE